MSDPITSIIILTYNNLDLTRQCVASVLEHTLGKGFELILVDNASTDGTQEYLQNLAELNPNVRILLNEMNEGFARGNNLGAEVALGEYLVFLNNDTLVTPGWLQGLLSALADPLVGMVGPVTNSSGNETRIQVNYTQIEEMESFARQYTQHRTGRSFEISMLAFLCVAMRKSVYEQIGPLDECFGMGMFEDDDYALRLKAKGYKLLCVEDVFVHHWGSASFSRLEPGEYWRQFERNLKYFEDKWGIRWLPHPYRRELIPEQLRQMVDGLVESSAKADNYYQQVLKLQELVQERDQIIIDKDKEIEEAWLRFKERDTFLFRVLWRVSLVFFPSGSKRERLALWLLRPFRAWYHHGSFGLLRVGLSRLFGTRHAKNLGRNLATLLPKSWKDYYRTLRRETKFRDCSQVILFDNDEQTLPEYPLRQPLIATETGKQVGVSLISTVRNEAANVESWFTSLLKQSRLPDEIVISDGGSTDETVNLIRKHAGTFPIPVQVIEAPGTNIARGRNIAIRQASHEVIACADFGCLLDQHWLENLILPFEAEPGADVSCGFSRVQPVNDFTRIAGGYFIPEINTVDPQQYMPSARNFAMRKQVWEQAGGYPEWLTFAGEDTVFALNAKLQKRRWAFVPQATVHWHAPTTLRGMYRTIYRYARGDGEAGLFPGLYWLKIKELGWFIFRRIFTLLLLIGLCFAIGIFWHPLAGWGMAAIIGLVALMRFILKLYRTSRKEMCNLGTAYRAMWIPSVVNLAQPLGFAVGVANQGKARLRQAKPFMQQLQMILEEHPDRKGVIIYPATHDWGFMFQRPHQMARALAHKGYLYFYCSNNEITDDVIGFRRVEPYLYLCHVPYETFKGITNPIVYIGSPWHRQTLQFFNHPKIIYDYYDDLRVTSGRVEDFNALLQTADVIMATAQRLLEDIKQQRPDVIFVPNGVDVDYIQAHRPDPTNPPPEDWQPIAHSGKPVIGYSGALAEWFDYQLLAQAAQKRPDLEFVLLGVSYDGSLDRSGLLTMELKNLHWLGMKPYAELFNYTWRFSAGIIPFKINEITLSTTPVKLFEYMACELPVVSTAMPEASKYGGVYIVENSGKVDQYVDNFLTNIDAALAARQDSAYQAVIRKVAQDNTWDKRVQTLLERMNQTPDG